VQAAAPPVLSSISVQQLYRYLDFTAKLEQVVVNRVVMAIANGYLNPGLPEEMVFDAFKIYCDEAYHALFSYDMLRQVEAATGIPAVSRRAHPFFMERLHRMQHEYGDTATRELLELFFVIVSETLISGLLSQIPASRDVKQSIRGLVRDHAIDEGRHHAYFAELLRVVWARLPEERRRLAALRLPDLIFAFLHPDLPSIRAELMSYGFTRDQTEQVLAETYTPAAVGGYVRASTTSLIRYLRELEVFEDPEAGDRFRAVGLID
jgi:hypothetical protein